MSFQIELDSSLGVFDQEVSQIMWEAWDQVNEDDKKVEHTGQAEAAPVPTSPPLSSCSSIFKEREAEPPIAEQQPCVIDQQSPTTASSEQTKLTPISSLPSEYSCSSLFEESEKETTAAEHQAVIADQQTSTTAEMDAPLSDFEQNFLNISKEFEMMIEQDEKDFENMLRELGELEGTATHQIEQPIDQCETTHPVEQPVDHVETTHPIEQPVDQFEVTHPIEQPVDQVKATHQTEAVPKTLFVNTQPIHGSHGSQKATGDPQNGSELKMDVTSGCNSHNQRCDVPKEQSEHGLADLFGLTLEQIKSGVRNQKDPAGVRNTMVQKPKPAATGKLVQRSGVQKSKPAKPKIAIPHPNIQIPGKKSLPNKTIPSARQPVIGNSRFTTPHQIIHGISVKPTEDIDLEIAKAQEYYLQLVNMKRSKAAQPARQPAQYQQWAMQQQATQPQDQWTTVQQSQKKEIYPSPEQDGLITSSQIQQQGLQNAESQHVPGVIHNYHQQLTKRSDSHLSPAKSQKIALHNSPLVAKMGPHHPPLQKQQATALNSPQQMVPMTPSRSPGHGQQVSSNSPLQQMGQMASYHSPTKGNQSAAYNSPQNMVPMTPYYSPMRGNRPVTYNPLKQMFPITPHHSPTVGDQPITYNPPEQMGPITPFQSPMRGNGSAAHHLQHQAAPTTPFHSTMHGNQPAPHNSQQPISHMAPCHPPLQYHQVTAYNLPQNVPQDVPQNHPWMGAYSTPQHAWPIAQQQGQIQQPIYLPPSQQIAQQQRQMQHPTHFRPSQLSARYYTALPLQQPTSHQNWPGTQIQAPISAEQRRTQQDQDLRRQIQQSGLYNQRALEENIRNSDAMIAQAKADNNGGGEEEDDSSDRLWRVTDFVRENN